MPPIHSSVPWPAPRATAPRSRSGTARGRNCCWLIGVVRPRLSLPTMTRCAAPGSRGFPSIARRHTHPNGAGGSTSPRDTNPCAPAGGPAISGSSSVPAAGAEAPGGHSGRCGFGFPSAIQSPNESMPARFRFSFIARVTGCSHCLIGLTPMKPRTAHNGPAS
jgi:hypothetical protein